MSTHKTLEYYESLVPEYSGNPLIEAIKPMPEDDREAFLRLKSTPDFDTQELELKASARMCMTQRLRRFIFPTEQFVRIFKKFYGQLLDGYSVRNPLTAAGQHKIYKAGDSNNSKKIATASGINNPACISFITGVSGMGKTTLTKGIMRSLGEPVIRHTNYKNIPFTESQILYLKRNVPDQCSTKALCKSFGDRTAELLNMPVYSKIFSDKSLTRTHYVAVLRQIIANHHVGAIIIDEIQNISLAKSGGKDELIALILNLRDELGVPIILVGTYKAADLLKGDASVARRLSEGGYYELRRPERPDDKDWSNLCKIVWKYQWVKNPKLLTPEIMDVLYDCSQGVTGIMLNLFIQAQMEAIESGSEIVDTKMLKKVYREQLTPLHGIIDALRSKDSRLLNTYDDLYPRAFAQMAPKTSQLEAMEAACTRHLSDSGKEEKGSIGIKKQSIKKQRTKLSSEDLLNSVTGDNPAITEVFSSEPREVRNE